MIEDNRPDRLPRVRAAGTWSGSAGVLARIVTIGFVQEAQSRNRTKRKGLIR